MMIPWMVLVTILLLEEPSAYILFFVLYGFRTDLLAILFVWIIVSVINVSFIHVNANFEDIQLLVALLVIGQFSSG